MCLKYLVWIIFVLWTDPVRSEDTKQSPYHSSKVVGGSPTTIDRFPILAQLLVDTWGNQEYVQHCAGVILTARHVISTAHCFQYNVENGRNYTLPKYWRVRVGSSYRTRGGTIYHAKKIIPHLSFDKKYFTNDIAVVVVAQHFALGPNVRQATITKFRSEVKPNSFCYLAGWGAMASNEPQPEQLQYVGMHVVDHMSCSKRYDKIKAIIADSMMCAGKLDIGGADGCFGDSGGPLIYKGVVIGLVSFGFDCGHRYYPGVYTKISYFTDWIVKTIMDNKS